MCQAGYWCDRRASIHKIMQFDYSTQPVVEVPAHQMTREEIDAAFDDIPF